VELKKLPENSGVYIFKDKKNVPIYIGKSANIKKRVNSHFNRKFDDSKESILINKVKTIEAIRVDSEIEALILEANLIKKYKPLYNTQLKDDKDYLYMLDKLISDKNLGKRVLRVGYTPYPQLPIAFQASDIFVLPSSYEGLPKVVMQSLGCGVPALVSGFKIATHIDGLYYLTEVTPQQIAVQIKEILGERRPVDILKISKEFSWAQKARQIDEIYKFMLTKHADRT